MHQKNIMAWKKAIKNSKWLIQTIYKYGWYNKININLIKRVHQY